MSSRLRTFLWTSLLGFLLRRNLCHAGDSEARPNVIFFLTDDWGFNDVGYNLNSNTETPFIDELATTEGLIISKYYAMHTCTISRSTMLTGRYSLWYGLQYEVLTYESNYALTLKEALISQEFQSQGYSTHIIGKWHLGHMLYDYTPTRRGFDSFVGYYGGMLHYYSYLGVDDNNFTAYDLRHDEAPLVPPDDSVFSLNFWYDQTIKLVKNLAEQPSGDPFFLYLSWQGSHEPAESPQDLYDLYYDALDNTSLSIPTIKGRCHMQAQTHASDRLFESFVTELKHLNLWDNTLLVFASDNGGLKYQGDNAPLRGAKSTLWEGGIRVPAFLTGGKLPQRLRGTRLDSYPVHVVDWYPTLLAVAGLKVTLKSEDKLDGKNVWKLLQTAEKKNNNNNNTLLQEVQTRSEAEMEAEALRVKEVFGVDGYQSEEWKELTEERTIVVAVNDFNCAHSACGALIYGGRWKYIQSQDLGIYDLWYRKLALYSNQDILGCGSIPSNVTSSTSCKASACLFDLLSDPCEYYDVSDSNSEMLEKLAALLEIYYDAQAPDMHANIGEVQNISDIDPTNNSFGGTTSYWGPWAETLVTDWTQLEFEQFLDPYYADDTKESDPDQVGAVFAVATHARVKVVSGEAGKQANGDKLSVLGVLLVFVVFLLVATMFYYLTRPHETFCKSSDGYAKIPLLQRVDDTDVRYVYGSLRL